MYNGRWAQLDQKGASTMSATPQAPLSYWDIPWPLEAPTISTTMVNMGGPHQGGTTRARQPPVQPPLPPSVDSLRDFFLVGVSGPSDVKRRLRTELLRWHPDKFGARFGARLEAAGQRKVTLVRVQQLAQVLTQVLGRDGVGD